MTTSWLGTTVLKVLPSTYPFVPPPSLKPISLSPNISLHGSGTVIFDPCHGCKKLPTPVVVGM